MSDRLVITHAGCSDGFCCAWLCHRVWPNAKFVFANYGDQPPDVTDMDVIITDFSYNREILEELRAQAHSLVVLDHHHTAKEELKDLPYCVFDMDKSGGRLTWEHLCLNYSLGLVPGGHSSIPWLVAYTEDRDLWRFKLPHSREINAALRSYPFEFAVWNTLLDTSPTQLKTEGAAILRYRQLLINQHLRYATEVLVDGIWVYGVGCTVGDIRSELGEQLTRDRPFSITWTDTQDGRRLFSLRSNKTEIDVSAIAKKFGGGGHRQAAGFTLNLVQTEHPRQLVEPFPFR